MSGRRLAATRSGDICEDLGVTLLKRFAAVAVVGRPEDVGIDAVATLLRREDKMFYAEDSFFVQIKGSSVRKIKYADHEVKWLKNLELPLFIDSVDNTAGTVELFSTHQLSQIFIEGPYDQVELFLDPKVNVKTGRGCHIGPPVLKWGVNFVTATDPPDKEYRLLKTHIEIAQRNLITVPIRYREDWVWKTGYTPKSGGVVIMGSSAPVVSDEDTQNAFQGLSAGLHVLAMKAHTMDDRPLFEAVRTMIGVMRERGHQADPKNLYGLIDAFWDLWTKHNKPEANK